MNECRVTDVQALPRLQDNLEGSNSALVAVRKFQKGVHVFTPLHNAKSRVDSVPLEIRPQFSSVWMNQCQSATTVCHSSSTASSGAPKSPSSAAAPSSL